MSPTPFSILFEAHDVEFNEADAPEPDYFGDLNLDQVVAAALAGREQYNLAAFFNRPLTDQAAVRYRQDVFRDLESGLAAPVETFAAEMRRMHNHLVAATKGDHRFENASWFLDAGNIYCEAVLGLEQALAGRDAASEGFERCRNYLRHYVSSGPFRALLDRTKRLKSDLTGITYGVRVRGSRVIVTPYAGEADYSAEVLETFKRFRQGDAESRLVKFSPEFTGHIQHRIVDLVARLHPEVFDALLAYHQEHADFLDAEIARFEREVQFYLGYLNLLARLKAAGLAFCLPAVSSESKYLTAVDTFDLALATKLAAEGKPIVSNDLQLKDGERIFVVSGPNQGGKTTFARTFGQLHFLAALGCPVPGTTAHVFLCDRIFAHFEKEEQVEDLHSKLEDELLRVREILRHATDRSVLVLNESLAATTVEDALHLGQEVIGRIIELDALGVYVTFIDELSRLGPSVVSMVSTVEPGNPAVRTFKVVRRPADGRAYATAIAEKHRLTYGALRERLRR